MEAVMADGQNAPVAVITGGTRGIGLAIAERMAADGYDLLLTYRGDAEAAEAAQKALADSGRRVEVVSADISTAEGATSTIETATKAFGKIDVLINNAGITRDSLIM